MENDITIDDRIAVHLKQLRQSRGWSLDDLAERAAVSRASLSRLENAETSPTAAVLGRLCTAFGMPMSRLLQAVEDGYEPKIEREAQSLWVDPSTGYARRSVSPPAGDLAGELIEAILPPASDISYQAPARIGLEHHLVMLEGQLSLIVEGREHHLSAGDCLRYKLTGHSRFITPADSSAKYLLFML